MKEQLIANRMWSKIKGALIKSFLMLFTFLICKKLGVSTVNDKIILYCFFVFLTIDVMWQLLQKKMTQYIQIIQQIYVYFM